VDEDQAEHFQLAAPDLEGRDSARALVHGPRQDWRERLARACLPRHRARVRRQAQLVLIVIVLAGTAVFGKPAAATSSRSDTRALCDSAAELRDGGSRPAIEIERKWKAIGREYPQADPRLHRAIALIDDAVISRRAMNIAKFNRAYELVATVCGEVRLDDDIIVRVTPTGGYEASTYTANAGLVRLTLVSDHDAILVIEGVDGFILLVSGDSGSSSGTVRLAPGRYRIASPVASERAAGEDAVLTVIRRDR
jgi:hypothetical protein